MSTPTNPQGTEPWGLSHGAQEAMGDGPTADNQGSAPDAPDDTPPWLKVVGWIVVCAIALCVLGVVVGVGVRIWAWALGW